MRCFLALLTCLVAPAALAQTTVTVTTIDDAGPGSLREAIAQVNHVAATTPLLSFRIAFDTGTSNHIVLQSPLPPVTARFLTLAGEGMRVTRINGNQQFRVLESGAGNALLALEDIGLHGGRAERGACIGASHDAQPVRITLDRVWMAQCLATQYGGAILAHDSIEVRDSVFLGNRVHVDIEDWGAGGAIYKDGAGELVIERALFDNNYVLVFNGNQQSTGGGGAIMLQGAPSAQHRIVDWQFVENKVINGDDAQDPGNLLLGGAVQFNTAALTVARSVFRGNWALRAGGAIAMTGWVFDAASLRLDNVSFHDNAAQGQGGAVHLDSFGGDPLRLVVRNSLFYRSLAEGFGEPPGTAAHHLHFAQDNEVSIANSVLAAIGGDGGSDSTRACNAAGAPTPALRHNAMQRGLVADCDLGGDALVVDDLHLGLTGKDPVPLVLGPASPLIDAGSPAVVGDAALACAVDDALGVSRPVDGDGDGSARCDIGPVEFRADVVFGDGFEAGVPRR